MTAAEMIRRRGDDWRELEALVTRLTRGARRVAPAEQLSRLAALFRSVCADLAYARAQQYPDDLIDYLNALAARSHNVFYTAPPTPAGRVGRFFTELFPLAVRRNRVYVAAGLLLFFGPMTAMVALSRVDSATLYELVPEKMLKSFEQMYRKGHDRGRSESTDVAMAGFYVRNNIGIAFQCFATGVFFGLGSIFFLSFNGVIIGAVMGFISGTPAAMNLLSFIAGHGPFELFAIALAGAAGLRLGFGPIITGNRPRTHSLRLAAADAVLLVLGSAALLLAAALIEGFFSPSSIPPPFKFAFGGLCALFLVGYLAIWPRRLERRRAAAGGGA